VSDQRTRRALFRLGDPAGCGKVLIWSHPGWADYRLASAPEPSRMPKSNWWPAACCASRTPWSVTLGP